MKIIWLVSSGNRRTNPRLHKEIEVLKRKNFKIQFIGFDLPGWPEEKDPEIETILIDPTRTDFTKWIVFSILEKLARLLNPLFSRSLFLSSIAHSKRTLYLLSAMQKMPDNPDLIIAHTLPSLYPAFRMFKKKKVPFAFDIEDWHPGEIIEPPDSYESDRRKLLMKNILAKSSYISLASPLFEEKLKDLLDVSNIPVGYIANAFSISEFNPVLTPTQNTNRLKVVWFSQNISAGRGLELFLPVLYEFKNELELTLIGKISFDFRQDFLVQYSDFIEIIEPLPQKELNLEICRYDLGLAIDLSSRDANRDIAITNKIHVYFQAGLFILATDTLGHQAFLELHPHHGVLIPQLKEEIRKAVINIIQNKERIQLEKSRRFKSAEKYSWESESEKFIQLAGL